MNDRKRERLQTEGRIRARQGKTYPNSGWQDLTSSHQDRDERSTGFRREKLTIEREKEREERRSGS